MVTKERAEGEVNSQALLPRINGECVLFRSVPGGDLDPIYELLEEMTIVGLVNKNRRSDKSAAIKAVLSKPADLPPKKKH